jgi:hypothetical protein
VVSSGSVLALDAPDESLEAPGFFDDESADVEDGSAGVGNVGVGNDDNAIPNDSIDMILLLQINGLDNSGAHGRTRSKDERTSMTRACSNGLSVITVCGLMVCKAKKAIRAAAAKRCSSCARPGEPSRHRARIVRASQLNIPENR